MCVSKTPLSIERRLALNPHIFYDGIVTGEEAVQVTLWLDFYWAELCSVLWATFSHHRWVPQLASCALG